MPIYLLSGECRKDWNEEAPVTFFCGLPVKAKDAASAQLRAEIVLAPFGKIDTVRPTDRLPDISLCDNEWMQDVIGQLTA